MEIREVRVRNIRSFEKGTLTLGPGTSLLWGDVGAGKTSLLHAVEMALFGFSEVDPAHLIRHRATTAEVSLTISDGAHEYRFARRFHRRMRRGRDLFETDEKGTGLSIDGIMTRYPATELRQRAIDLLGFPDNPNPRAHSDLWRWAVYVPQERMRQILESEDSDARLETVRKALGLEKYRTAAENAKLAAQSFRRDSVQRTEQAGLLSHWESDLLDAESALRGAELAAHEALRAESEGRTHVDELTKRVEAAEGRARQLEADRRELRAAEARAEELAVALRTRAERLSDALERERAMGSEIERLRAISQNGETLRAQLVEIAATISGLSEAVEAGQTARRELEVAQARSRDGRVRLAEDRKLLERATFDRGRAAAELARRESEGPPGPPVEPAARALVEIETSSSEAARVSESRAGELRRLQAAMEETDDLLARGICPRCGQPVTAASFEGHRTELAAALELSRREYEEATRQRESVAAERLLREGYERTRLSWNALDERRRTARADLERIEAELRRSSENVVAREREVQEAESTIGRLSPQAGTLKELQDRLRQGATRQQSLQAELAEADRSTQEIRLRREGLEALEREVSQIRSDEALERGRAAELEHRRGELSIALSGAPALDAELEKLSAELGHARSTVEAWVGRLHRSEGDRDSANRRILQAQTRVVERERLRVESNDLGSLASFLTGPFRDAMLELEHRLLARAKVEFDRSFGRYFAALIEDPTYVARSDPRFNPSVEIDGELTPPEALSGGERTALALAFRLALGDVVRSLDRLNLSTLILDEPTDGFSPEQVQRMGELLSDLGVPQVILVSHEAALNGVADRVIRVRKVAGASELWEEGSPAPIPEPSAPLDQ